MKHTPGPWSASAYSSVVGSLISSEMGYSIAAVMPQVDRRDALANTCLIEAAPELLEACRNAKAVILTAVRTSAMPIEPCGDVLCVLEAAIAKAEGTQ